MRNCKYCLWSDQCSQEYGECEDYTPIFDDCDSYIEESRTEFIEEWFEYVEYCDED